jgi:hypothetical protein
VDSSSNDGDAAHIRRVSGTVGEAVELGNTVGDHSVPGTGQNELKHCLAVCVQMDNVFFNFPEEGFDVALDKERANGRVNALQRLAEHIDGLAGRTACDARGNGCRERGGGLVVVWERDERLPRFPETGRRVSEELSEGLRVELRRGGGKECVVRHPAIAPAARPLADGRRLLRHGCCSLAQDTRQLCRTVLAEIQT